MSRVYLLLALVNVAFMVFSLVDVLLTQKWRVRGVPKVVWAFIVVLVSPIGGILWFLVGKEKSDSEPAPRSRQLHPDDDPDFLARIRLKEEQDERIRRLEQELADLDDDPKPEK